MELGDWMKGLKGTLCCFSFLACGGLPALVDYSDDSGAWVSKEGLSHKKKSVKASSRGAIKKRSAFALSPFKADISLGREGIRSDGERINFWIWENFVRMPWDFFLQTRYRRAEGGGGGLGGNGMGLLGFNWLRYGGSGNRVDVDIFGGVTWGRKGSRFATSRIDKMFGLKTRKSLYRTILEMGFQHHLTGRPEEGELAVGDIQTVSMELGQKVSHDIFVGLEGGVVRVSPSERGLAHKMDWVYLSPLLKLNFSSMVAVSFEADLRTARASPKEARKARLARLWDFPAACGDSLKVALALTF